MRKLIYISILITFGFTAFGQGLYRLAEGVEMNSVELVSPVENGLFIFNVNTASEYEFYFWNGFSYSDYGVIPNIPKHGIEEQANFKIVDALQFDGKLFVLGHDFGPQPSSSPSRMLTWDGNQWADITTNEISTAYSASKLIEYNGKLCVLGIFSASGILYYDAQKWVSLGNVLGGNAQENYVLDAIPYRGKIYATGDFTNPSTGRRYNTARFENNEWKPLETPPFIGNSKHLAVVNGELLLTGEANIEFDYIKSFNGVGWNDLSKGLEDILIQEFWDVSGHDELLCLTGMFRNKLTGRVFNYITKDAAGWHFGENSPEQDQIKLVTRNKEVFAYGNFRNKGVHSIGEVAYNTAIISGKVFFDENNNCQLDGNESGLNLAKVILNPGRLVTYTDKNGNYEFPIDPGLYTITFEPGVKNGYGCGRVVSIEVVANTNYTVPELTAIEIPNIVDLELSSNALNGWSLVKGEYNEIKLNAYNNGSVKINGATLQLKMGDWWDEVSIIPAPNSSTDGEMTWEIADLEKGAQFSITISGKIKSDLSLYNDFCFTGDVDLPQKDMSAKSNRDAAQLTTVNALDPITKQVDCGAWYSTSTDNITYHIRFENEANEVVNNVTIVDTFDADLLTTWAKDYTDIGSTKQKDVKVIKDPVSKKYRILYVWHSTNVNLAPAGDPDHKDVGYAQVKFKLHSDSKVKGIELCNKAHVQFGNNEPLYTNTVCSKATNVSVPKNPIPSQVSFFPNPAEQNITFKNDASEDRTVEIYNQMGQLVESYDLKRFETLEVDVNVWASGIYMVQILGFETQKLVVQ